MHNKIKKKITTTIVTSALIKCIIMYYNFISCLQLSIIFDFRKTKLNSL